MPIEVRELVIKAVVTTDDGTDPAGVSGSQSQPSEKLVRMCVDQVMEILREKQEK